MKLFPRSVRLELPRPDQKSCQRDALLALVGAIKSEMTRAGVCLIPAVKEDVPDDPQSRTLFTVSCEFAESVNAKLCRMEINDWMSRVYAWVGKIQKDCFAHFAGKANSVSGSKAAHFTVAVDNQVLPIFLACLYFEFEQVRYAESMNLLEVAIYVPGSACYLLHDGKTEAVGQTVTKGCSDTVLSSLREAVSVLERRKRMDGRGRRQHRSRHAQRGTHRLSNAVPIAFDWGAEVACERPIPGFPWAGPSSRQATKA